MITYMITVNIATQASSKLYVRYDVLYTVYIAKLTPKQIRNI